MNVVVVSMSQMAVSASPDDQLVTYSLGSCLGIGIYDTRLHVAGLMHCMLPQSSIHPQKAAINPCMFVDTGFPVLIAAMQSKGCRLQDMVVRAAGAACMIEDGSTFRIGERNCEALYKALEENEMELLAESTLGHCSRTIHFAVAQGVFMVKKYNEEREI